MEWAYWIGEKRYYWAIGTSLEEFQGEVDGIWVAE